MIHKYQFDYLNWILILFKWLLSEYVYWTCLESWIGLFWYLSVCLRRSVSAARSRRGRGGGRLACCPFFPSEKTQYRAHIVHSNFKLLQLFFHESYVFSLSFKVISDQVSMDTLCERNCGMILCVWKWVCVIVRLHHLCWIINKREGRMMSHCCW